jgi:hypothetical protein
MNDICTAFVIFVCLWAFQILITYFKIQLLLPLPDMGLLAVLKVRIMKHKPIQIWGKTKKKEEDLNQNPSDTALDPLIMTLFHLLGINVYK